MKKLLFVLFLLIGVSLIVGGIIATGHFEDSIHEYYESIRGVNRFFDNHEPSPFINDATLSARETKNEHPDERYSISTPEGFRIISYSEAWNEQMLELLYRELKKNRHGSEIELLYEIVIYPDEVDGYILGMFSPFTASMDFALEFPVFPEDFSLAISRNVGRIVLTNGDTNTTIESMAAVLSHEYGHLFTFYHMFGLNFDNVEQSEYAILREASRHGLITDKRDEQYYRDNRHRFLIEVAAEDFVQIMGSPTTRQVGVFFDVKQGLIDRLENPPISARYRNVFPQENMRIPLASEVPGLREFFFSFIGEEPPPPIEERKDVTLDIRQVRVEHNLATGPRTFIHYVITWNTPYTDAIYTLAYYDPDNYDGWGIPIRTVFPGQQATATIGEVTIQRGNQIHWMNDNIAQGRRVFYVVALLPDGTFYISDKLTVEF